MVNTFNMTHKTHCKNIHRSTDEKGKYDNHLKDQIYAKQSAAKIL